MTINNIAQSIANLDAWLDTMRVPATASGTGGRTGYGGPVVHWWQNCLAYTGPGLDWRYEGIISGYLTLWHRTGQQRWLDKAVRAGDDLVQGQLPSGNFAASCFELNPYSGGTPHEAAASLGLLRLARALRDHNDDRWRQYAATAERNLRCYSLQGLWDPHAQSFRDHPAVPSLVPNKACTLAEALFALAELKGDDALIEQYALPTLNAVLTLQKHAPSHLAGGIPQNSERGHTVHKYFPYYIARCIPALVRAHEHTGHQRYLDGAAAALTFIATQVNGNGLLPQLLYPRGGNTYPRWIAPLGDILRAAALLQPYGVPFPATALYNTLLSGQLPTGGFTTGCGFGSQVSQNRPSSPPDFRDAIPVAGWSDKAFHYLATCLPAGATLPTATLSPLRISCTIKGHPATWTETESEMKLTTNDDRIIYHWQKGQPWASIIQPEVMWK